MQYKVVAKRYGDSVELSVEGPTPKQALEAARREANVIFGYRDGDAVKPTVTVKPETDKDKD